QRWRVVLVAWRAVGFLYSSLPSPDERRVHLFDRDGRNLLVAVRRASCETKPEVDLAGCGKMPHTSKIVIPVAARRRTGGDKLLKCLDARSPPARGYCVAGMTSGVVAANLLCHAAAFRSRFRGRLHSARTARLLSEFFTQG